MRVGKWFRDNYDNMQKYRSLVLPVAIVVGLFFHHWLAMMRPVVPFLLFIILFLNFSAVEIRKLRLSPMHVWMLLFQAVVSLGGYLALRPFDTASKGVHVIRGFANGYLFYGQSQDTANEPLGTEPSPCRFAASRLDETTWLAEFAIPFSKVSLPKGSTFKAKFSLTVRKGLDNLWLQAEPTLSNSYNVDNAFILEGK